MRPQILLMNYIFCTDRTDMNNSTFLKAAKGSYTLFFLFIISSLMISINTNAQSKDGEIYTPDSYDSPYIEIVAIEVEGNKKTKDRIIIRELDFKLGDSLATFDLDVANFGSGEKRINSNDSSEIARRLKYSRENIINTQLFLTVDLYLELINEQEYKLRIKITERWYFWVIPVVKLDYPNFNDWLKDPDPDYINMGLFMSHNNLWGRSHQASIVATAGSSQAYGLGYFIPWIGSGQKIGLRVNSVYRSSAVVEYGSVNNERQMMYNKNSMNEFTIGSTVTIRPGLYNYITVKLDGGYVEISDSLKGDAPNYLPDNKSNISMVNLYLDYYYDSRNSKAYPLKGNYLKAFVDKKGTGIISKDVDYFFYGIDFHFYQKLSERFYVAEMFKLVKSSSEDIPYYFKKNLTSGSDFIRGYDYYALRGDEMYYFRNNFKYELIKPNVKKPRKEKYKESKFRNVPYAFYLNAFADAALMVDEMDQGANPYNNEFIYSWGLGVDFISYYDLVLRFEYAFTSVGKHGFYFGFGMPI